MSEYRLTWGPVEWRSCREGCRTDGWCEFRELVLLRRCRRGWARVDSRLYHWPMSAEGMDMVEVFLADPWVGVDDRVSVDPVEVELPFDAVA